MTLRYNLSVEVRDICKFITKNIKTIVFSALVCGVLGAIFHFVLPQKYIATGSFYVARKIQESSKDFFEYEGYYANQSAQAFAQSVISLLESKDLHSSTLQNMGVNVTESSLRDIKKSIRVKKVSPQLITLVVKKDKRGEAINFWMAVSQELSDSVSEISKESDSNMTVVSVSSEPVVFATYKNVYINFLAAFLLGFAGAILYLGFRQYLKG